MCAECVEAPCRGIDIVIGSAAFDDGTFEKRKALVLSPWARPIREGDIDGIVKYSLQGYRDIISYDDIDAVVYAASGPAEHIEVMADVTNQSLIVPDDAYYLKGWMFPTDSDKELTIKLYDKNGNEYRVLKDKFSWDIGLCLRNFKTCGRIANIDVEKLDTDEAADIIKLMVQMYHRVKKHAKLAGCKLVIYVNETIETYLHLQAMNKENVRLSIKEVAGEPVLTFLGIPVKCCDAILDNEEALTKAVA